MIDLSKVRAKNFFNIGNGFVELDIKKYSRSVITGKNGAGKSTFVNAISFGLFGNTIKNVNKPQIVNSINTKNCLVEIEFHSNNKHYLVRRGLKPAIFEIYEDAQMLDQTGTYDFQEHLEKNILKTSFRTFTQTAILSIENYKPFMSLKAADRRNFVEDILDIRVFTFINQLIKQKVSKAKEELNLVAVKLQSSKQRAILQKSHIDKLSSIINEGKEIIRSKIQDNSSLIADNQARLEKNKTELSEKSDRNRVQLARLKEIQIIQKKLDKLDDKIEKTGHDLDKLKDGNCPVCKQDTKDSPVHGELEIVRQKTLEEIKELKSIILDYPDVVQEISELEKKISSLVSENKIIEALVKSKTTENKGLTEELERTDKSDDIDLMKSDLRTLAQEALGLKDKQAELNGLLGYYDVMLELFKDSGIKSKIVAQYIPIINQTVNFYLDKLDFFVSFELDDNFNEIIKSRHRDMFSYESFSAGERQRIDLALMFTFRHLAGIRNSLNCNLLFLDEILDSSLDMAGIDNLVKIFESDDLKDSNIFVISHRNRDTFEDIFDGSYEIYREQGFSQLRDMNEVQT